jgi:hypothetical protein
MWQAASVNGAKRPAWRHWLDADHHPTRRDGAAAIALFLLPWTVLIIVHGHRLDVGTLITATSILAAASIGLPTLWITWVTYRTSRQGDSAMGGLALHRAADLLADSMRAQWHAEAAMRRLNDPYPMPVSWMPADPSLADSWDSLLKLASTGAGWPRPSSARSWADSPSDLAGSNADLVEVLARVPTGRLVVLGEAGAGKTILMVRLVLDLLARRAEGAPVPILVSAGSW